MTRCMLRISWTRRIALLLCLGILLATGPARAPVAGDTLQIERLIALGKLWVTVKYFHPWLAYKNID